jgi:hypothetical protein
VSRTIVSNLFAKSASNKYFHISLHCSMVAQFVTQTHASTRFVSLGRYRP